MRHENLGQFSVLIVDDDEGVRDTIIFYFKRKGFSVYAAENGEKAFEIVKTKKIHLVVSDMRMPGGGGMSLLEEIRAHDPSIPTVIFVTGFTDVTEEQALAKGARKVLSKPFDRKVLMNSVPEALGLEVPKDAA